MLPTSFRLADYNHTSASTSHFITVIANYETGCGGGRREASIFAAVAQAIAADHPNVMFFASVKGSG